MATLLPTDGPPRDLAPTTNGQFTLKELQTVVGGFIEVLSAPDGRVVIVNEDGKRLNLPVNQMATRLMGSWLQPRDYIVGTALVCTLKEAGE